jgi:hypothetical protein
MTGTVYTCLHTNYSRSYLNHLVYEWCTSRHSIGECLSFNQVNTVSIERVTEDYRQASEGFCECGPPCALQHIETTVSSAACSNINSYYLQDIIIFNPVCISQ